MTHGTTTNFYCRKRILGRDRPVITRGDVTLYVNLSYRQSVHTELEFSHVTNIRAFTIDKCSCGDYSQRLRCYHIRAARIARGIIIRLEIEYAQKVSGVKRYQKGVRLRMHSTLCIICNRECQNENNYLSHCRGNSHMRQIKKMAPILHGLRSNQTLEWAPFNLRPVRGSDTWDIRYIVSEI